MAVSKVRMPLAKANRRMRSRLWTPDGPLVEHRDLDAGLAQRPPGDRHRAFAGASWALRPGARLRAEAVARAPAWRNVRRSVRSSSRRGPSLSSPGEAIRRGGRCDHMTPGGVARPFTSSSPMLTGRRVVGLSKIQTGIHQTRRSSEAGLWSNPPRRCSIRRERSTDSPLPRDIRAMPEEPSKPEGAGPPVVDHIEELAHRLRDAEHLDPEARAEVADLLRSLAQELDRGEPSEQEEHLGPYHRATRSSRERTARPRPDRSRPASAGGSDRERGGEGTRGDRYRSPTGRCAGRNRNLNRSSIHPRFIPEPHSTAEEFDAREAASLISREIDPGRPRTAGPLGHRRIVSPGSNLPIVAGIMIANALTPTPHRRTPTSLPLWRGPIEYSFRIS